ncbi:polar amino acid transport system substrate-binding protein [Bradyrhizobium sp. S3.12.5]|uniref:transporter substrate-binding domain-containing protein n=1 Tax=Bradyrhizobium sp. S3.12.5 TaxID=3156386 RepID=UPI00339844AE
MVVRPRFLLLVLLLAVAIPLLPTFSYAADSLLRSMHEAGEAKAAITSAPPFAFVSPSGEPQGYLVEVTILALKGMDVPRLSAVLMSWGADIAGLQARHFDLVPGGLLITAARCNAVSFSAPITAQQDALYVPPGNPKRLTGYIQFAQSFDLKLAVVTGSAQEGYAATQGVKSDQLVRVPDIQAGIATVLGGRTNAFAVGQFSVPNPQQKGVEIVVDTTSPVSGIGIAFKEDAGFRDTFNAQLEVLRRSGALKELYAEKYGFPNWDTLATLTKASDVLPGCE